MCIHVCDGGADICVSGGSCLCVRMAGIGTEGLSGSPCAHAAGTGVCVLWEGTGAPAAEQSQSAQSPGSGGWAGKGGLAHTHRDFGTFEKAASTALLPSPRQTRWVGRKLEPSEAPVGLTQLHAHYPASPL